MWFPVPRRVSQKCRKILQRDSEDASCPECLMLETGTEQRAEDEVPSQDTVGIMQEENSNLGEMAVEEQDLVESVPIILPKVVDSRFEFPTSPVREDEKRGCGDSVMNYTAKNPKDHLNNGGIGTDLSTSTVKQSIQYPAFSNWKERDFKHPGQGSDEGQQQEDGEDMHDADIEGVDDPIESTSKYVYLKSIKGHEIKLLKCQSSEQQHDVVKKLIEQGAALTASKRDSSSCIKEEKRGHTCDKCGKKFPTPSKLQGPR